ncbi:hypothetical protein BEI60_22720 [Eisenbergiella tayi]|nr:hypothetical protein BEI60_22720 [Eisenbergiella tayi]
MIIYIQFALDSDLRTYNGRKPLKEQIQGFFFALNLLGKSWAVEQVPPFHVPVPRGKVERHLKKVFGNRIYLIR